MMVLEVWGAEWNHCETAKLVIATLESLVEGGVVTMKLEQFKEIVKEKKVLLYPAFQASERSFYYGHMYLNPRLDADRTAAQDPRHTLMVSFGDSGRK